MNDIRFLDLLFSRYSSPLVLVGNMIRAKRLTEFVSEIVDIHTEEQEDRSKWEYWLHKDFERSFGEFLKSVETPKHKAVSQSDIQETVKSSFGMLNGFFPD